MNFSNSTAQHQEQQLQRGALSFPPVNHQQRPVNHQNSPHNTMQQQFQQQHVPLPQQQQQQHQQQHQQGQQNGGGQPGSAGGAAAAAAAAAAPQMSLAGVLHYLQSEWRRWERDRNEWEIERAEMRARIALLEGERRSAENLKSDMMRRVKMLEFALRQERSKTLSSAAAGGGGGTLGLASSNIAPSSKLTSIIAEDRQSASGSSGTGPGGDKESGGKQGDAQGRSRGSSSPRSVGSSLPNDPTQPVGQPNGSTGPGAKRSANASSASSSGDNAWSRSIAAPIRDPKSRAKSREYLKQCLQEISYLTSPAALNPLPTRVPITLAVPEIPGVEADKHEQELPGRPKKELPSEAIANAWGQQQQQPPQSAASEAALRETTEQSIPHTVSQEISDAARNPNPDSSTEKKAEPNGADSQDQLLTAIYKPESKEAWKEALRAANQKAEQAKRNTSERSMSDAQAEAEARQAFDAAPSQHVRGTSLASLPSLTDDNKMRAHRWSTRAQLKSHLDAVRAIAFGLDSTIISASIDCTVKVWRPDHAIAAGKPPTFPTDAEAVVTLRGHTAGVTSLAVSRSKHQIFSGSIDASIRVWNLPPSDHETYSPHDATLESDLLVGHGDAIWDLALVPSATDPEGYLVSASADGTVKIWQAAESKDAKGKESYSLMTSFGYSSDGDAAADKDKDIVPVSVGAYHQDLSKVLVGFSNSVVKVFDIKSGNESASFGKEDDAANGNPSMTQALSHPELPIILTAHDDGTVRILNGQTGDVLTSFRAHADTVNCLDIDPVSHTEFVTAGDDCSCKIWTLHNVSSLTSSTDKESASSTASPTSVSEPTCIQEWTLHRRKSDQGVLSIKYMDSSEGATTLQGNGIEGLIGAAAASPSSRGGVLASGGADGIVRVYSTSIAGGH